MIFMFSIWITVADYITIYRADINWGQRSSSYHPLHYLHIVVNKQHMQTYVIHKLQNLLQEV